MDDQNLRRVFKRVSQNSIGYTLVELLTVLAIILVLATIGIFAYNRAIAYAKGTVCQTNLRALEAAIELYAIETDALPASLGRLKREHLEKGYAKAMSDRRWLRKLSFFLIKVDSSDEAYAQFLTPENLKTYGGSEKIFHDPADSNGGASYGINGNLFGKQWSKIDKDELIIADSDHYVFTNQSELAHRHKKKAFAINMGSALLELDDDDGAAVKDQSKEKGKNKKDKNDVGSKKKDNSNTSQKNEKVEKICHKPGTGAEQTMSVSESTLPGHLGHGDTLGACPEDRNQGGNGG